ncbi:hypothetical protein K501DRAFT_336326 [Backusella circina FSU 941]|nr:hypothetical protein K501DRAFT_336326 [Backusella circina FSU 941]
MVLQTKSEKQTKFRWSTCLSLFNKKSKKKIRSDNLINEKIMDQKEFKVPETLKESNPPLESNPLALSALSPPPYKKQNKHRTKLDPSLPIPIKQQDSSRSHLSVIDGHSSLGGILLEQERKQSTLQCRTLNSSLLLHTFPPPLIPLPPTPSFRFIPKQDTQLRYDSHNDPYEVIEFENISRSIKTDKARYDDVVARAMRKKHS